MASIAISDFLSLSVENHLLTRDVYHQHTPVNQQHSKSLPTINGMTSSIMDTLGNIATLSELANVMLDFSNPTVR